MSINMKLRGFLLILFLSMTLALTSFSLKADDTLIGSYWLTKKVLVVGCGDKYIEPIVAIKTKKGIVLIDSGSSPSLTMQYRKIIETELKGNNFKYLINTHHHGDHVNGNQVFKDAEIIAHKNVPIHLKKEAEGDQKGLNAYLQRKKRAIKRSSALKKKLKKNSALYNEVSDRNYILQKMCDDYDSVFRLTLPSITFSDFLTLDMGDLNIKLFYFGPGYHTDNDIFISIPEEKLVFTGDIIAQKDLFAESSLTAKSNFSPWIACLDQVFQQTEEINNVVTFHFGVLPGSVLKDFHIALKRMRKEQQQMENAVDWLRASISASGYHQAIQQFAQRYLNKKNEKFYIWEREMIALANELQREKKYYEAIGVLNLNRAKFPHSATTLNILGALFTKVGKKKQAISTYKKLIEIGPINAAYIADLILQLENSK